MAFVRKTKLMYFAEIREIVEKFASDRDDYDDLLRFIDREVENLNNKKQAAAKRQAKKKAKSDALTDEIFEQITDQLATIDEILLSLSVDIDEDVSRDEVASRLSRLVRESKIVKEVIRINGKRKTAYKLPIETAI